MQIAGVNLLTGNLAITMAGASASLFGRWNLRDADLDDRARLRAAVVLRIAGNITFALGATGVLLARMF